MNLYAYCNNNPINYVDPSGHSAIIIGLIVGLLIGSAIGFGSAAYIDYKDDGSVFNGSVEWYNYLGATLLGGTIGAGFGAGLGAFAGMSLSLSVSTTGLSVFGGATAVSVAGTATVTITGAQVLTGVAVTAGMIIFSKIPYHGIPNSSTSNGTSFGKYDNNGNLSYRIDFKGKPHFIKSIGKYCLPHKHIFKWQYYDGVWQKILEEVIEFLL